mmetsp:Transcript_33753/g.67191  ORF Transcript_33753/g.67191 Transcript_33753/m.67191 type:complete len:377 (+) Transcript_33753:157-1287(+)
MQILMIVVVLFLLTSNILVCQAFTTTRTSSRRHYRNISAAAQSSPCLRPWARTHARQLAPRSVFRHQRLLRNNNLLRTLSTSCAEDLQQMNSQERECFKGEVVGATGRIGSFIYRAGGNLAAVPRDAQPGSLSDEGRPIFVAVPAVKLQEVIQRTVPERRNDLVFVTNGIPSDYLQLDGHQLIDENLITTSVPYFGVLGVGEEATTGASSPSTIINNGRHSQVLADLLESSGIGCEIVNGLKEVDAAAIQKLIWVSIMWLLCHDDEKGPITVAQVHEKKDGKVVQLLQELIPAANHLLEKYHQGEGAFKSGVGSIAEVKRHLLDYSSSMPSAVPSKKKAIEEFKDRNGYLLSMEKSVAQTFHRELVQNVVGYVPGY